MANQRSPGQQLLAFTLDKKLAERLDRVSQRQGRNRSEFIRTAIVGYLEALGEEIPEALRFAPDRRSTILAEPEGPISPMPEIPKKKIDYRKIPRPTAKKKAQP